VRLASSTLGWDSLGFWFQLTRTVTVIIVLAYTIGYSIIYQVGSTPEQQTPRQGELQRL
jgi:hypothetical protein